MTDAPPDEEAAKEAKPAKPPGPKTPKLILLLLLINLGGTGFNVFQGMQQAQAAHPPPAGEAEEKAPEKKKEEVGPVITLDPFIINLNEKDASRYLKVSFELEVKDGEVAKELERLKRAVRDDVLRYLSSLTVGDTQGEDGKTKIQQEIVKRIDAQLGGGKVKRLFFVEFVVQ